MDRPKVANVQALQANILDAAMKVFSTSGYTGAGIRAIAKASGISTGGVYLYFRNKEYLYLDLIKFRIEDQDLQTKEIVSSAGSSLDALNAFLSLHLEYGIKNKQLVLINIREHGFSFGLEIKRKFFRSQIRLLVNILTEGIRNHELRGCKDHHGNIEGHCAFDGYRGRECCYRKRPERFCTQGALEVW